MTDGISILFHAASLFMQAALMSAVALGAWTAMGDGMILERFRKWLERTSGRSVAISNTDRPTIKSVSVKPVHIFPSWVRNPIVSCCRCMCSVWGIAALLVCGFGVGITINFAPDNGLLHFNEAMLLVETEPLPLVAVDWSRLAEIPFLILAAVGIQEMWHRP